MAGQVASTKVTEKSWVEESLNRKDLTLCGPHDVSKF